jgi:hypothetical protein
VALIMQNTSHSLRDISNKWNGINEEFFTKKIDMFQVKKLIKFQGKIIIFLRISEESPTFFDIVQSTCNAITAPQEILPHHRLYRSTAMTSTATLLTRAVLLSH